MKRILLRIALETGLVLMVYAVLLHSLAGTNVIAGILCPGPHLPAFHPVLIALFLITRLYIVLLPGILLARIGYAGLRHRLRGRTTDQP